MVELSCEKCQTTKGRIIYYMDKRSWFCGNCYQAPARSQGNLHIKKILFRKNVSQARINALKDRAISKDDGKTVIDSRTGKPITQTGYGYA